MKNYKDKNKDWFEQWLVGFTDGDGSFTISYSNNKWSLIYKLVASRYNIRVLYYIKSELGFGSVTKDGTKGQFLIRDRKVLENYIIPIFDKHGLLTSKEFNYIRFREALYLLKDSTLSKDEKDKKLFILKNSSVTNNYIPNTWKKQDSIHKYIYNVISKAWLVGFVEAESSFYLVSKESDRIVHGFGITQKLDKLVLDSIRNILHIPTIVKYKSKHNFYSLDTTNSRAIENIIKYFDNTMKGMKSLEYKIWARSYRKNKGNYKKLLNISNIMRKLKKNLNELS